MKLTKNIILASSLLIGSPIWAQQAETTATSVNPFAKSWAGSYLGVTLGRSQGERRTVSSGSSSGYGSPGNAAYCWNVQSQSVVPGQTTSESCYTSANVQGSRVWYPQQSPTTNDVTSSDFSENSSVRQRNAFGLKAGHNWQNDEDRVVYGLEADFTELSQKNSTISSVAYSEAGASNLRTTTILNGGIHWLSTLRARVGYASEDNTWLPYLTAGVAFGRVKTQGTASYSGNLTNLTNVTDVFNDSSVKSGMALGGGLDYRISENLILNLSYMRIKLGSKRSLYSNGQSDVLVNSATAGAAAASLDPYVNLAAIGLSYKFD